MKIYVKHIFSHNDSFLGLPNVSVRVNGQCNHADTYWEDLLEPRYLGEMDQIYATKVEVCTHCHAWVDPKTGDWVESEPNYEPDWCS